ncbi:MAG: hypothetical protein IJU66_08380 [Oscillospiraceae bacterium]|nr:hypothetical protein [Oscillospiraceae bacterium]
MEKSHEQASFQERSANYIGAPFSRNARFLSEQSKARRPFSSANPPRSKYRAKSKKNTEFRKKSAAFGAAGRIRTADLILTNRLWSEKCVILCEFQLFYVKKVIIFWTYKSAASTR